MRTTVIQSGLRATHGKKSPQTLKRIVFRAVTLANQGDDFTLVQLLLAISYQTGFSNIALLGAHRIRNPVHIVTFSWITYIMYHSSLPPPTNFLPPAICPRSAICPPFELFHVTLSCFQLSVSIYCYY